MQGMSRASSLFRLQRQDQELEAARMKLASIQAEIATAGGLDPRRNRLQAGERALQAAKAEHARAENEVAVLRAKLEATEAALYGGSVRNPKELADLQQESEALRRHITVLDDRLLETMLTLEGAEMEHGEARSDLEAGEAGWSLTLAQLERSLADWVQQIDRLEGEREAAMASVPAGDLVLYESLRRAHGGSAVAEILDACCGSCGVAVPPSIAQTARNSPELVRCRQCNRILYAG
jgi:predicted  nucleic acid-binding Zn-ribbon protein